MTVYQKLLAAVAILAACALSQGAEAATRTALVIGNGAYQFMPALANPANDANLIAGKLAGLGFEVVRIVDGDRRAFREGFTRFGRQSQDAEVALVFYAGHGVQVNGQNWLLPVDAEIQASTDLPAQALRANDLLEIMDASGARLKLVFFDACRNNPLPRSLSRGAENGLARLEANAAGMMIAFATSPGDVALDGAGSNSPFTEALARLIDTPDLEVRHLMGKVRESVYTSTGERQLPWLNEALIGEFYFGGRNGERPQPVALAPAAEPAPAPSSAAPPAQSDTLTVSRTEPRHLPEPAHRDDLCRSTMIDGSSLRFCASSILDPQYGNRYGPGNLFDGNGATAWVEGVSGTGAGQKVLIAFDRPRLLTGFKVTNGYAKNRDIYRKNARVHGARLRLSDGSSLPLDLPDEMAPKHLTFGTPVEATWVELEIATVFPGSKYADTAVSELVPVFGD